MVSRETIKIGDSLRPRHLHAGAASSYRPPPPLLASLAAPHLPGASFRHGHHP